MAARWVSELSCPIIWVRLPPHRGLAVVAAVAGRLPHLRGQPRLPRRVQHARLQPVPMQRQSLALCHVQPAPMRRWVVRRTRLPQALGLQRQPLRLDAQPLREARHR
jgi:hypothetical protein